MRALQFSVTVPQWLAVKTLGFFSKRLFYSGPLATVKLVDAPEPGPPSPEWIKIKTKMCGFCASDLNLLLLKESPSSSPFTSFPCTMGHELCGEVVETGDRVDGLEPGDMVVACPALPCKARGIDPVCPSCAAGMNANCENYAKGDLAPGMFLGICRDAGGGFAPYFAAHRSQVFKLPDGAPPEAGVMMEPLSVGLQAVMNNKPGPDDRVLVIGGGVIGNMVVQAIRGLDVACDISVSDPSVFAGELALKVGADRVIANGDLMQAATEHAEATRYKPMIGQDILMGGFNRIYDTVGSPQTLNLSLRCMKAGGVLSQVGIWHDVKLDLTPLWLKHLTVKGVFGCGYGDYDGRRMHMFDIGIDLLRKGKVSLAELVTHTFDIENFRDMIEVNLAKEVNKAFKTAVAF